MVDENLSGSRNGRPGVEIVDQVRGLVEGVFRPCLGIVERVRGFCRPGLEIVDQVRDFIDRVRGVGREFVDQEFEIVDPGLNSSTRSEEGSRVCRPGRGIVDRVPRICRPGLEIVDQVRDFIDRVEEWSRICRPELKSSTGTENSSTRTAETSTRTMNGR
ncbi:unnamed protein product [Arabidopsis thaliana]|uniref:Uncharacterized protein n=1 Tax=Arabidopsis thaliana TaxID=3702 RepID=A0A654E663_ARATH|nr:unnamed protein product [Arabidopsis thaliana]